MTRQRLTIWTSILPLVFLGFSTNSAAQALFESHDIIDVRIEAPLTTLARVRSDVDYLDGTFAYTDEMGADQSFDIKLRARGRFRRLHKTCNFPPIRLNFKKGQVKGSVFGGEDKLKLVTHCQNRRTQSEQFVLREYMAYRIFQILTERSFGARLFQVTYVNNENDGDSMTKLGFVIEDEDSLGERMGMKALEIEELSYSEVDAARTNLVNLFQYMIGNTDYSLIKGPGDDECCHNSVPFSDGSNTYPTPYDFDFSGLVDAPYAVTNPMLKLRSVRVRLYRGRCSNGHHLDETIALFLEKKSEIYGLLDEIVHFDRKSRQYIADYLDEFYDRITDSRKLERYLIKRCS